MALVPAICTQCGAQLEVDNSQEAAICKYCGTPFIVEKAINNYVVKNTINVENASINVSGVNIDSLLKRALEFEIAGDIDKALEYCNRVLDVDFDNETARSYIARLEKSKGIEISGVLFSEEVGTEIINLLKRSEKVKAIKIFRETTGWDLKASKDAIDQYFASMPASAIQSQSAKSNNTSSGGCYIATCVYGSYDCPEVWTLRRFRDYTLDETWYGRLFIKCYYAVSPTLVKWFGDKEWFRTFWKSRLDKMIADLANKGVSNTRYTDKY